MSISITQENKNTLAITNESKISSQKTWDEMTDPVTDTWDEDIWDAQGLLTITKESKNSLTITNESKT